MRIFVYFIFLFSVAKSGICQTEAELYLIAIKQHTGNAVMKIDTALAKAAEIHAIYLAGLEDWGRVGHNQENILMKTPLDRAKSVGVFPRSIAEIILCSELYKEHSAEEVFLRFKKSDKHWDIVQTFGKDQTQIKIGLSYIKKGKNLNFLVVLYSY